MCLARILSFVAVIVLSIRAGHLNVEGHPQTGTSVALGIAIVILNLFLAPSFRPKQPPAAATEQSGPSVEGPSVEGPSVEGHDESFQLDYNRGAFQLNAEVDGVLLAHDEPDALRPGPATPSAPSGWRPLGSAMVAITWLARSALAGYVAYYVSQELDRGFNLALLQFSIAAQVLILLRRAGHQLAGFRLDWSGYRGWGLLGKVLIAAATALVAGYVFVAARVVGAVGTAVPRFVYRTLDGMWHLPWLNVPIVVVVCVILGAVVLALFVWMVSSLGPDSAIVELLDKLGIVERKTGSSADMELFHNSTMHDLNQPPTFH